MYYFNFIYQLYNSGLEKSLSTTVISYSEEFFFPKWDKCLLPTDIIALEYRPNVG